MAQGRSHSTTASLVDPARPGPATLRSTWVQYVRGLAWLRDLTQSYPTRDRSGDSYTRPPSQATGELLPSTISERRAGVAHWLLADALPPPALTTTTQAHDRAPACDIRRANTSCAPCCYS
jgi:hypothetical protein